MCAQHSMHGYDIDMIYGIYAKFACVDKWYRGWGILPSLVLLRYDSLANKINRSCWVKNVFNCPPIHNSGLPAISSPTFSWWSSLIWYWNSWWDDLKDPFKISFNGVPNAVNPCMTFSLTLIRRSNGVLGFASDWWFECLSGEGFLWSLLLFLGLEGWREDADLFRSLWNNWLECSCVVWSSNTLDLWWFRNTVRKLFRRLDKSERNGVEVIGRQSIGSQKVHGRGRAIAGICSF